MYSCSLPEDTIDLPNSNKEQLKVEDLYTLANECGYTKLTIETVTMPKVIGNMMSNLFLDN